MKNHLQHLRRLDGILPQLIVEVVPEQLRELDAQQSSLCNQGTVLLYLCHKMRRRVVLCEDQCFTAKRPHLRSADVEHVGQASDVAKGHVVLVAGQGVSQTCTVQIQRNLVLPANQAQGLQFPAGVQRTVLRRLGNVQHARKYHVLMISVPIKILNQILYFHRIHLAAVVHRYGKYFMTGVFDGAGFVGADMSGLCGNNTFIWLQHGIDNHLIRLGTAGQKMNICIRHSDGLANADSGLFAKRIVSVTGHLLQIGGHQSYQYSGVSSLTVVVLK